MKKEKQKKYSVNGTFTNDTRMRMILHFPESSKVDKIRALADVIDKCHFQMCKRGYVHDEVAFYSPSDLSREYGSSRQYWEKLLREGKIQYKITSAGMITTEVWVKEYLNGKEEVDVYVRNVKNALRQIAEDEKRSGLISCPQCSKSMIYYNNVASVNGICRECNFYLLSIINQDDKY